MIENYRGFTVCAKKEKCLAGYKLLYFYASRDCDGLLIQDGFTEGSDTVRDYVAIMKNHVDHFIETKGASEDMPEYWKPSRGKWRDTMQRLSGKWSTPCE